MQTRQVFVGAGVLTVIIFIFGLSGLITVPAFAQTDTYTTGTTSGTYCPQLSQTTVRGSSSNQVLELQKFLTDHFVISAATIQTGYFGRITQSYLIRFQQEQGLPSHGIAGSMTRAAIERVCGTKSPVAQSCPIYSTCPSGDSMNTSIDANGCTRISCTPVAHPVAQSCTIYSTCPLGDSMNTSIDANGCTRISCTPVAHPVAQSTGSFTVSQTSGSAPLTVIFSGSSGQSVVSEVVVWIDFGDGSVDESIGRGNFSKTHTYTSPGTYTAKLQWRNFGPVSSNFPTNTVGTATITVGGQVISTPSIRIITPNGGETLKAGTATTVQWDASNIPITTYVGGARVSSNIPATTYVGIAPVSYKIGLKLINPNGEVVGYIPVGSDLFDRTTRSTQWDPASLSGGFSALNQLKVRASVIKQTNLCVSAAAAYSSFATSPVACTSEETVASDDSDGWFSVKGVTVCNNKVTPMVCTQS